MGGSTFGVFGEREHLQPPAPNTIAAGDVLAEFEDGSPAVLRVKQGQGSVIRCGFHPGLAYLHPALPRRPIARGTNDDSFNHFLPTEFNVAARDQLLLATAIGSVSKSGKLWRVASSSEPLVDLVVITAPRRNASVVVLTNWMMKAVPQMVVNLTAASVPVWATAERASGLPLNTAHEGGTAVFTLGGLVDGDAIILRG